MGDVTVNIEGLDGLEQMLLDLVPKAAKTALRRAVKQGAAVFQDAIEEKAPVETGFLESHIKVGSKAGAGVDDVGEDITGSITASTGPAKQAYYGLFQEFGTKDQPAHPFVTPAYEENKDKVIDTFADALREEIEKLGK